MNKLARYVTLWSAIALCSQAKAEPKKIQSLINATEKKAQISAHFVRLSDGKVLLAHNAKQLLTPASSTKLVTAAAALHTLSSRFSFKTQVYYTGQLKNGVLKGDLIVVGSGDPFLVSEKLWEFTTDLKHLGLKRIEGNLLIDQGLFDSQDRDKSRLAAEKYSRNAYDAPILPFSVNFNTYSVAVSPGLGAQAANTPQASIWPYPLGDTLKIDNRAKISSKLPNHKVSVERLTTQGKSKILVKGSVSQTGGLYKAWKSVSNATKTSGAYLLSFLKAAGIGVTGVVRQTRGTVTNAKYLATIEGYPLQKSISGLNKFSNNFIADMLVKKIGHIETSRKLGKSVKGTFENGMQALSQFLVKQVGIKSNFVLKNGSGLSLANKLSAEQLTRLLSYMHGRLDLYPEFLASLPASGWDGTLRNRFKSYSRWHGKVRAKTGTLSQPVSVSSLAGYFHHKKHGRVAFAIIENGIQGRTQPAISSLRIVQEKLITYL